MKSKIRALILVLAMFGFVDAKPVGPYVGNVSPTEAHILFSPGMEESQLSLVLTDSRGKKLKPFKGEALKKNDYVAKFHLTGLKSGTSYLYEIYDTKTKKLLVGGKSYHFNVPTGERKTKAKLGFIACVNHKTRPLWKEIKAENLDALCLAGDTPYIDSRDLTKIRSKHRAFLQTPELAEIGKNTAVLGNWDDHDFGANNGNGQSFKAHKHKTLQVFKEYRVNDTFGNGKEGVYHKSDHGAIEVFHLDPRYFSRTAPSPVDPNRLTCFGKDQWEWILKSLKASKATFKVLSMGAIWQDKKSGETDDMFTYWYERDALLDFIKKEKISGVVLHGGDIHVSRYLMHPQRLNYDLHDFIMSPGHTSLIKSLDVYHPSYEWSLLSPQQYLTMEADTTSADPTLTVKYKQLGGKVTKEVKLKLSDLTPVEKYGLEKGLRAHWSFDKDFSNDSVLGSRVDATAHSGAELKTSGGVKGGAVKFERAKEQYLNIPRSMLDDTSPVHTVAFWCKPTSLPKHGSKDRMFFIESTAEGKPYGASRYHLSFSMETAGNANDVGLALYTRTVQPSGKSNPARDTPKEISQGPFKQTVKRSSLLNKWTHVVLVFDSKSWKVYLNGKLTVTHTLPIAGPAGEFGGIVLGGHRSGKGRNYDGWLDEVSIWQRRLNNKEIEQLHQKK